MRLDAYLAGKAADLSRSRAKALILSGHVAVDGTAATEPRRAVRAGETVIVIDKPPGLVVHPAAGNQTGTLVNALIAHCGATLSGIGGVARPGIVHRLDKDTSGLMVVAKTDRAHRSLAEQFADHGRTGPLERGYLALVWGAPSRHEGTIDAPLGRSVRNREKIAVKRSGGREAITHFFVRERYGPKGKPPVAALVECRLETGRTHQIRVHMAAIGHPVIGDRTYGAGFATKTALLPEPARSLAAGFPRQALHAYLLGFAHPVTGEEMRFEAPLPDDVANLAQTLKSL
jgi:23S rRNA pseudouridine1911/1915/1917 synthase